jgi:DNA-damage-inducible protein J
VHEVGDMSKETTTLLRIRIDESTKQEADKIFEDMGMTTTSAVKLFLRQSIISRKLPFQPVAQEEDGFYGEVNLKRLRSAIAQLKSGGGQVHEVIEP